jgi:hypothetical protein
MESILVLSARDPARLRRFPAVRSTGGRVPSTTAAATTPGPMSAPRSPFLLVPDVAARYHVSAWTVHERARLRLIPHRKLAGSGSRLLFVPADLDAYDEGAALDVRELPSGGRIVRPLRNGEHPEASSVEGTGLGTPQREDIAS